MFQLILGHLVEAFANSPAFKGELAELAIKYLPESIQESATKAELLIVMDDLAKLGKDGKALFEKPLATTGPKV